MASQACPFVGFLISFTAFNVLYNLLSSPHRLQPGLGEEEPPGKGHLHPAPRDVGTNSPIGTARKTLGTTPPHAVCAFI